MAEILKHAAVLGKDDTDGTQRELAIEHATGNLKVTGGGGGGGGVVQQGALDATAGDWKSNTTKLGSAAIDLGSGASGFGTQRVILASNNPVIPVNDNSDSLTVDAPISTPVGVRISNGLAALIGQQLMAGSLPVTMASDQSLVNPAATSAVTSVSGSASSVQLLAANANRLGATIFNDSTATLYVKFGTIASTTSHTVQLKASAYYEVPFNYTGRIDGIWSSMTGAARITELTT